MSEERPPGFVNKKELREALKKAGASNILVMFEEEEKWREELHKLPSYDFMTEYEKRQKKLHQNINRGCAGISDVIGDTTIDLFTSFKLYEHGIKTADDKLISEAIKMIDPDYIKQQSINNAAINIFPEIKRLPSNQQLKAKIDKAIMKNVKFVEDIHRLMKDKASIHVINTAIAEIAPFMQSQEIRLLSDCQCAFEELESR